MTTKLIGYSFVPAGTNVTAWSGTSGTATASDFLTTFAPAAPDTTLGVMKTAMKNWTDNCDMLFIQVPDVANSNQTQVRFFAAPMTGLIAVASGWGSSNGRTICFDATSAAYIKNNVQQITGHELGHSTYNLSHTSRTTSIMLNVPGLPAPTVPDATDKSNVQSGATGTSGVFGPGYGIASSTQSKVAGGTAIGEVYTAYKCARGSLGFGVNSLTDNGGLLFWVNGIQNGTATLTDLAIQLVGLSLTTSAFTTQCYQYGLGRIPTAPEIATWATSTKAATVIGIAQAAGIYRQGLFPNGSNLWFS